MNLTSFYIAALHYILLYPAESSVSHVPLLLFFKLFILINKLYYIWNRCLVIVCKYGDSLLSLLSEIDIFPLRIRKALVVWQFCWTPSPYIKWVIKLICIWKISQKKFIDSTEILSMILVNEMLNECFFGGGGWMASSIFVLLSWISAKWSGSKGIQNFCSFRFNRLYCTIMRERRSDYELIA